MVYLRILSIGWAAIAVTTLTEQYVLGALLSIGVIAFTYYLNMKFKSVINVVTYTAITLIVEGVVLLLKVNGIVEIGAFYIMGIYILIVTSLLEKASKGLDI